MEDLAKRNVETFTLLQLHKKRQLEEGMLNARRKGTNASKLINAYLDHVRTHKYTGTIGQYALIWLYTYNN